jgi:hypothetical protein
MVHTRNSHTSAHALIVLSAEHSCDVHIWRILAIICNIHDSHLVMPLMAYPISITFLLNRIIDIMDAARSSSSGYGRFTRQ